MYIHLGQDVVVKSNEMVGIFDLEKCSLSKHTKKYLSESTKKKEVITVSYEMPKTFIVTAKNKKNKVYISQIACSTLKKRAEI